MHKIIDQEVVNISEFSESDKENLLESVTFTSKVRDIRRASFKMCRRIRAITFEEGVEEIGEAAFFGCENLKEVSFPKSLKRIGREAFRRCISLEKVQISDELLLMAPADVFTSCPCEAELNARRFSLLPVREAVEEEKRETTYRITITPYEYSTGLGCDDYSKDEVDTLKKLCEKGEEDGAFDFVYKYLNPREVVYNGWDHIKIEEEPSGRVLYDCEIGKLKGKRVEDRPFPGCEEAPQEGTYRIWSMDECNVFDLSGVIKTEKFRISQLKLFRSKVFGDADYGQRVTRLWGLTYGGDELRLEADYSGGVRDSLIFEHAGGGEVLANCGSLY